jgi:hypothetical protein
MMVMLYHFEGEWEVATMGVVDGSNTLQGGQSVRELFFEILGNKLKLLPTNCCLVFELLSPKTKGFK